MGQTNIFDCGIPIYLQLMEKLRTRIVSGFWPPGERIPAVRELALEFGVNPNTMQRALAELEREGLMYSERTAGRFITSDEKLISVQRDEITRQKAKLFRQEMYSNGYTDPQILEILQELAKTDYTNPLLKNE